jgi:hypothetical protein
VRRGLKVPHQLQEYNKILNQFTLQEYTRKVPKLSKTNHMVQVLLQASTNMSSSHIIITTITSTSTTRLSINHPSPRCQKGHVRPSVPPLPEPKAQLEHRRPMQLVDWYYIALGCSGQAVNLGAAAIQAGALAYDLGAQDAITIYLWAPGTVAAKAYGGFRYLA